MRFLAAIVTSGHGKDGGINLNAGVTVASLLPTRTALRLGLWQVQVALALAAKSSCLSARVPNAGGDAQARASARKSRQDSDGRPAAELEPHLRRVEVDIGLLGEIVLSVSMWSLSIFGSSVHRDSMSGGSLSVRVPRIYHRGIRHPTGRSLRTSACVESPALQADPVPDTPAPSSFALPCTSRVCSGGS